MRRFAKIIFATVLFTPLFAQAACSVDGYTVVFINGVSDTLIQADEDKAYLQEKLPRKFNGQSVIVKTGYNQTHLAVVGDLIETVLPVFDQYDLDTILTQMHADVTTRKILLVGHSQGSVYANKIYEYLTTHGMPTEDVAVYAVATPDSYVAGNGTYINYELDTVIYSVLIKRGIHPLQANATLADFFNSPDNSATSGQGHSFIDMYLGAFGTRMVNEMQSELAGLQTKEVTAKDGCFDPPENGLGYKIQQVLFAVADPAATGIKVAAVVGFKGASLAFNGITGGLAAVGSFFGSVADTITSAPRTTNLPGSFNIVKALYGSSADEAQLQELLGDSQGGAVALAAQDEPVPKPETDSNARDGVVLGAETENTAPPAPQTLELPPMYSVGGGGTPGFGGGGSAGAASAQEETVATDTAMPDIVATTTETATSTEVATSTPASTTITEQLGASILGETKNVHIGNGNPTQKLGTGLSGPAGSVAYRLYGSDLASTTAGISAGFGEVQLFACASGSYIACGSPKASSGFHPQVLSQSGNNATLLVDMTGSAYSFDPGLYYYLMWVTAGDMAVYGSASDTYANGHAQWFDGAFTDDANLADAAFRICNTAACVLP